MPMYMIEVAYTPASAKAFVAKPQNRADGVRGAFDSAGGKLHSFHFAFGEYDAVLIAELPSNVAAGAIGLAVAAGGGVSKYRTTVLMTAEEAMEAMKLAKKSTYKPAK